MFNKYLSHLRHFCCLVISVPINSIFCNPGHPVLLGCRGGARREAQGLDFQTPLLDPPPSPHKLSLSGQGLILAPPGPHGAGAPSESTACLGSQPRTLAPGPLGGRLQVGVAESISSAPRLATSFPLPVSHSPCSWASP